MRRWLAHALPLNAPAARSAAAVVLCLGMSPLHASGPDSAAGQASDAPAAQGCEPPCEDCDVETRDTRQPSARPQPLDAPDWWNDPGMGGNPMSRFGVGHCHEFDDGSMFCH